MCGTAALAIEVGLQRAIEMLVGQILECRDMLLEGGIVDENVEAAELLHGRPAEFRIGHIA